MLKDEIQLLSGQAVDFTMAFKNSLRDQDDIATFQNFVSSFFSVTAQPVLVTKEQLRSVQGEIHSRQILVNYVFGLRFFSLGMFTGKEIAAICESFAAANANRQTTDTPGALSVLPDDAVMWTVKVNELIALYQNNTWVIPLLALAFAFPSFVDGEYNAPN